MDVKLSANRVELKAWKVCHLLMPDYFGWTTVTILYDFRNYLKLRSLVTMVPKSSTKTRLVQSKERTFVENIFDKTSHGRPKRIRPLIWCYVSIQCVILTWSGKFTLALNMQNKTIDQCWNKVHLPHQQRVVFVAFTDAIWGQIVSILVGFMTGPTTLKKLVPDPVNDITWTQSAPKLHEEKPILNIIKVWGK